MAQQMESPFRMSMIEAICNQNNQIADTPKKDTQLERHTTATFIVITLETLQRKRKQHGLPMKLNADPQNLICKQSDDKLINYFVL